MRRENNLGTDSMAGLVVRLAIPAMLAQFINVLYSIVDRIFIGNIPEIGATALAGVGDVSYIHVTQPTKGNLYFCIRLRKHINSNIYTSDAAKEEASEGIRDNMR